MSDASINSMDLLYAQAQARTLTQVIQQRHFAPPPAQQTEADADEPQAVLEAAVQISYGRPAANIAQLLYEQQQLLDLIARLPETTDSKKPS